jgi:hypothetical protein
MISLFAKVAPVYSPELVPGRAPLVAALEHSTSPGLMTQVISALTPAR